MRKRRVSLNLFYGQMTKEKAICVFLALKQKLSSLKVSLSAFFPKIYYFCTSISSGIFALYHVKQLYANKKLLILRHYYLTIKGQ